MIEELLEKIDSLTVAELAELVKAIEENMEYLQLQLQHQ